MGQVATLTAADREKYGLEPAAAPADFPPLPVKSAEEKKKEKFRRRLRNYSLIMLGLPLYFYWRDSSAAKKEVCLCVVSV